MLKIRSNDSGLSLLELILLLSVLLLLTAMAVPQMTRYLEFYQLDSGTQGLTSNLEIARYTAISGRKTVVVQFNRANASYGLFEDKNDNGNLEPGERNLGIYRLPEHVQFKGDGLLGPPSDPSSPVIDPITFNSDRIVFNALGKINGGTGTVYLENDLGDSSAVSFNIASRIKVYRWDKSTKVWK
jgi:Tfp pilus assembly protein FimT